MNEYKLVVDGVVELPPSKRQRVVFNLADYITLLIEDYGGVFGGTVSLEPLDEQEDEGYGTPS